MQVSRWLLLGLALSAAACGDDPEILKARYFQSGQQYARQGKLAEAAVEYRNAIQQDDKFGEARYQLAETLRKNGDARGSYREYLRAADLLPRSLDAQLKAGQAYLMTGQFADARTRGERALALDGRSIEAHFLIAAALAGLKQLDEAIQQVETAVKLDPSRGWTYTNLGALHLASGNTAEAEKYLLRAAAIDPRSVQARIALAGFYLSSGQQEPAERTLKEALAIEPQHPMVNRLLAYIHVGTKRVAEAEPFLKTLADTGDPSAQLTLADFYRGTGRTEDALRLLDVVVKDEKLFGLASARKAAILFGRGDKRLAYSLLDQVLQRDATQIDGLLMKAQLLMADGKADDAAKAAKAAVAVDPSAVPPHFVLGRIEAARRLTEDAIEAYTEALRLSPRLVEAQLELAGLHLAAGKVDDAARFARDAARLQPDNPVATLMLARTQLASGDLSDAEESLKKLSSTYPEAAVVHAQLGRLQLLRGNAAAARTAFDQALGRDSVNYEALTGLLVLDAAEKKLPAARARIDARVAKQPDSPALLIVAARTYAAANDLPRMEQALRRAVELEPASLESYGMLGRLYMVQGKSNEALAEFDRIVARNPKALWAHTMAAVLLDAQQRHGEARARYEKILSIDPASAVAANNLAWLHAESGENLDTALQLAQTAKTKLPQSADVTDTLGWVYYKKGMHAQAIEAFKESVQAEPNRALFQYHLGFAYAKSLRYRDTRETLETALRLDAKAPEAAEARAILARAQPRP